MASIGTMHAKTKGSKLYSKKTSSLQIELMGNVEVGFPMAEYPCAPYVKADGWFRMAMARRKASSS
jgi:hypothetical protein